MKKEVEIKKVMVMDAYRGGYMYSGWEGTLNNSPIPNCSHSVRQYDRSNQTEIGQGLVDSAPIGSVLEFSCYLAAGEEKGMYVKVSTSAEGWLQIQYRFKPAGGGVGID